MISKTLKYLLIILSILHICSCEKMLQNKYENMEQFEALNGIWVAASNGGKLFETWEKENDSTLKGHGFLIVNKDTVFEERMIIGQRKGQILYSVNAEAQNNDSTVDFKLISDSSQHWIFENLDHDFPQRITYTLKSENALFARIEGSVKANPQQQDFNFTRIEE